MGFPAGRRCTSPSCPYPSLERDSRSLQRDATLSLCHKRNDGKRHQRRSRWMSDIKKNEKKRRREILNVFFLLRRYSKCCQIYLNKKIIIVRYFLSSKIITVKVHFYYAITQNVGTFLLIKNIIIDTNEFLLHNYSICCQIYLNKKI